MYTLQFRDIVFQLKH